MKEEATNKKEDDKQSKPVHTTLGPPHYGATVEGESCSECSWEPEPSGEFVAELKSLAEQPAGAWQAVNMIELTKQKLEKAAAYIEQLQAKFKVSEAENKYKAEKVKQLEAKAEKERDKDGPKIHKTH